MKTVVVCVADGVEDIEAVAPIDILTRCGCDVTVASLKPGVVHAAYGTVMAPSKTIDDVSGCFDAIVIPGGKKNAQSLAGDPRVISMIHEHYRAGKIVAAICASPSHVLGEAAGILKGKRSSGDPAFNEKLAGSGAIVSNENATIDGNIITAMGPGAAFDFAFAIAEALGFHEQVKGFKVKWKLW